MREACLAARLLHQPSMQPHLQSNQELLLDMHQWVCNISAHAASQRLVHTRNQFVHPCLPEKGLAQSFMPGLGPHGQICLLQSLKQHSGNGADWTGHQSKGLHLALIHVWRTLHGVGSCYGLRMLHGNMHVAASSSSGGKCLWIVSPDMQCLAQ